MSGNGNRSNYNRTQGSNRSTGNSDYIGSHSGKTGASGNRSGNAKTSATYHERRAAQNGAASYTNRPVGSSNSRGNYPVSNRGSAQQPHYSQPQRANSRSGQPQYVAPQRANVRSSAYSDHAPVRRSSKLGRILKLGVLAAAVIAVLYCAAVSFMLSGVNTERVNTHWQDTPASATADMKRESAVGVKPVLVIGADGDGGTGSRSDTLMIASVSGGKLRLCSILRDSYVEIPEHRASKINAALAFGGNELCMRTVESNFRIRIENYVRVDMDSLTDIINGIGGVDLTLTAKEAKAMNDHFGYPVAKEGTHSYKGKYAVYYARIRKIDDDFHRVERQRKLLKAVSDKCRHTSPLKLTGLIGKVTPYITTNMSSTELAGFGLKALAGFDKMEQMSVPIDGTWEYKSINGQSCISMNVKKNAEAVQRFVLFKGDD